MLLLAYLLTQNKEWSGANIRLIRVVDSEDAQEGAMKHLTELIASSRIPCEPKVCLANGPIRDIIIKTSEASSMVFLGMTIPPEEIMKAKVDYTIVGGKLVYQRQDFK